MRRQSLFSLDFLYRLDVNNSRPRPVPDTIQGQSDYGRFKSAAYKDDAVFQLEQSRHYIFPRRHVCVREYSLLFVKNKNMIRFSVARNYQS